MKKESGIILLKIKKKHLIKVLGILSMSSFSYRKEIPNFEENKILSALYTNLDLV